MIRSLSCHRYLVYNLRKRGGDSADKYFKSTELVAGVKDMRFQALMPDVLHWLGIQKIDNMISMSDMYEPFPTICVGCALICAHLLRKHDAIVGSGIPILKRYDLPGTMHRRTKKRGSSSLAEIRSSDPHGFTSRDRRQDCRRVFHQRETSRDRRSVQDGRESLGRGRSLMWWCTDLLCLKWNSSGHGVTR